MTSITSLPPEIINLILLRLNVQDIISLSQCFHIEITRDVYHSVFHDRTHFSHYDLKMFKARARASMYIAGDAGRNRQKQIDNLPPQFEYIKERRGRRMHTPCRIRTEDDKSTIVKTCLSRARVFAITEEGNILVTRAGCEFKNGPNEDLFVMKKVLGRQGTLRYGPNVEEQSTDETGLIRMSSLFYDRPPHKDQFVQLGAFERTIGLDSNGFLWGFPPAKRNRDQQSVPACLVDTSSMAVVTEKILTVKGSSFLVQDRGIFLIEDPTGSPLVPDGLRSGYPCFQNHLCFEIGRFLPGTEGPITDFTVIPRGVIILRDDGALQGVPFRDDGGKFASNVEKLNSEGEFVQLTASDMHMGMLTADGRFVVVRITKTSDTVTFMTHQFEELNEINIASICVDAFYFAVLTDEGDLYMWGTEIHYNGTLGLGKLSDVMALPDTIVSDELESVFVSSPKKVVLPGKVYSIETQENYWVALVDDK